MCEDNAISVLWEILLVLRLCVYVCVSCERSHVRLPRGAPNLSERRSYDYTGPKRINPGKELLRSPCQWWVAIGYGIRRA